jgi:hypothetical protein
MPCRQLQLLGFCLIDPDVSVAGSVICIMAQAAAGPFRVRPGLPVEG